MLGDFKDNFLRRMCVRTKHAKRGHFRLWRQFLLLEASKTSKIQILIPNSNLGLWTLYEFKTHNQNPLEEKYTFHSLRKQIPRRGATMNPLDRSCMSLWREKKKTSNHTT